MAKKTTPDFIRRSIFKTSRKLYALLSKRFGPYEITPEQWNVLNFLEEQNGLSQKELSNKAERDQTTLTRMMEILERIGAIRKEVNPEDKRSYMIYLTEKGRSLIEELQPVLVNTLEAISSDISEADMEHFERIHALITRNIEAETNRFL
jgi:MarR family transcriptional regulator for hemolysin